MDVPGSARRLGQWVRLAAPVNAERLVGRAKSRVLYMVEGFILPFLQQRVVSQDLCQQCGLVSLCCFGRCSLHLLCCPELSVHWKVTPPLLQLFERKGTLRLSCHVTRQNSASSALCPHTMGHTTECTKKQPLHVMPSFLLSFALRFIFLPLILLKHFKSPKLYSFQTKINRSNSTNPGKGKAGPFRHFPAGFLSL